MRKVESVRDVLQRSLREQPAAPLCVAYSGGPDSSALLHALASLHTARERGLRALHVDHGLHPDSDAWAVHCARFCASLELPCEIKKAYVDRSGGIGLEAAARQARYAIFEASLLPDEWLLLGHHRDDQVETVLLKMLRGAGPEGLGGMREQRPLGSGTLWRPLLGLPRQSLHDYAAAHALTCVDDPSNTDNHLSRNYLRHDILPRLTKHWPQAFATIAHSAALSRAAADMLQEQARDALERLRDPATNSVNLSGWLALPSALRDPLLDYWLHQQHLPAPTTAQRQQIVRQSQAQNGQLPCIEWPGAMLYLWKDQLWATTPPPPMDPGWETLWDGAPLQLPDGGQLRLKPDARLPHSLMVRWRRGGEQIKPAGDRHTRDLRALFQDAGIPPWQRMAYPLIWSGNELIAVANRWVSARGEDLFRELGSRPTWSPGGRFGRGQAV